MPTWLLVGLPLYLVVLIVWLLTVVRYGMRDLRRRPESDPVSPQWLNEHATRTGKDGDRR